MVTDTTTRIKTSSLQDTIDVFIATVGLSPFRLENGLNILHSYTLRFRPRRDIDCINLLRLSGSHLDILLLLYLKPFTLGDVNVLGVPFWAAATSSGTLCLTRITSGLPCFGNHTSFDVFGVTRDLDANGGYQVGTPIRSLTLGVVLGIATVARMS